MARLIGRVLAATAAFALIASGLTGCTQRSFWSGEDPSVRKLPYWDGVSVEQEHIARRNNADAGFGFSQGPSDQ